MLLKLIRLHIFAIILILGLNNDLKAQFNQYKDQTQVFVSGVAKDIGMGANGGVQYFIENNLSIQGTFQYEWGRPYQAHLTSVGLDLGGAYSPFTFGNNFFFNLKAYGSVLYQKITDRGLINENGINYGGKAGAGFEYFFAESLSAEIYGLQAFYAKKNFGQKSYDIGISLKFLLD